jgi:hypothetical protein
MRGYPIFRVPTRAFVDAVYNTGVEETISLANDVSL